MAGLDALTLADDGTANVPSTPDEWVDWVSATATRNFLLENPLLDWLDLYGRGRGFVPDVDSPAFDSRTDFTTFLFEKAKAFERAVVACLKARFDIVTIASERGDSAALKKAEATVRAMEHGAPIIYQPVLRDPEHRTYGAPDLLVRSDQLASMFPDLNLGTSDPHYVVVDIKFTTLDLLAGGELGNGGSACAYKGQLFIYNRALGRIQGFEPPKAYLLGRGWRQTIHREDCHGKNCLERLAPVPMDADTERGVADACAWMRRLRRKGHEWSPLPEPTVPELRPNMAADDGRWGTVKSRLADDLQELTSLWYVGYAKRCQANVAGIQRWTDPACTAAALGVTGAKIQPVLQALLDINREEGGLVAPARVSAAEDAWRRRPPLEFYVDFETVSDLDDDFSRIPEAGGQPLIFMIGCGHIEDGAWTFKCFTVDALTPPSEANVIDAWLAHMKAVRERLSPATERPLLIHWSPAETSNLITAYNAAIVRHPERAEDWSGVNWFDFLKHVVKAQPIVVRGAWGFGLKAIAQALHAHGLIKTRWEDGPADGLGAMVGAWWCAGEAARLNVGLPEVQLMQEIGRYNEVDCKVMMEIVEYLRANH